MRKMRLGVARDDGRAGADGRRRGESQRAVNYSGVSMKILRYTRGNLAPVSSCAGVAILSFRKRHAPRAGHTSHETGTREYEDFE